MITQKFLLTSSPSWISIATAAWGTTVITVLHILSKLKDLQAINTNIYCLSLLLLQMYTIHFIVI